MKNSRPAVLIGAFLLVSCGPQQLSERRVCEHAPAGQMACEAHVVTDGSGKPLAAPAPIRGYRPADLLHAYRLPAARATGTVAVVDAYDDPAAEADLNHYRSQWGLPPCTTANGCFRKVNQRGQRGAYPGSDIYWGEEISLDLDMVSAICPGCRILLVEADSGAIQDLGASVNTAVELGANAVSNSYGGTEYCDSTECQTTDEKLYYDHPGVAITASTGDSNYGVIFPATSVYVTAVGGTTLLNSGYTAANPRGWTETVWSSLDQGYDYGTGSGCSAWEPEPAWQVKEGLTGCNGKRSVADVSAVADPLTGVAVYDSAIGGWAAFGGTSVSSPIVAAVYVLAGNTSRINDASWTYQHAGSLFDVTRGTNSATGCSPAYLCTGEIGYDGPTGNGTPDGIGAF